MAIKCTNKPHRDCGHKQGKGGHCGMPGCWNLLISCPLHRPH